MGQFTVHGPEGMFSRHTSERDARAAASRWSVLRRRAYRVYEHGRLLALYLMGEEAKS